MSAFRIIHGDCIEVMRAAKEASCDAIVCDPPYALDFMGKDWDGNFAEALAKHGHPRMVGDATGIGGGFNRIPAGVKRPDVSKNDPVAFQMWCELWGREALRVLKPGGHLLAFGGTRTYHRLTAGLEDAGLEIRDCIMWLYGSGMPKNARTQLKPAYEPIVVARRPPAVAGKRGWKKSSAKACIEENGTGALNIEACTIGDGSESSGPRSEREDSSSARYADQGATDFAMKIGPRGGGSSGRWPANVILDDEAAAQLDEQVGPRASGSAPNGLKRNADKFRNTYGKLGGQDEPAAPIYGDTGGVSRFFYCAKASKSDKEAGLDQLPKLEVHRYGAGIGAEGGGETGGALNRNIHPTVKPRALMQYLTRLVTPPGGQVLDPFCGSGSTGVACMLEGFRFIGIEMEPEYARIATARIEHARQEAQG